jgi:hypothetical protein
MLFMSQQCHVDPSDVSDQCQHESFRCGSL